MERWQWFLAGLDFDVGEVDGKFGPKTEKATKRYQRRAGLIADGVVGDFTLTDAAIEHSFELVEGVGSSTNKKSVHWPAKPTGLRPLGPKGRERLFGKFEYERVGKRGRIKIVGDWKKQHIVRVTLPFSSITYGPMERRVSVHQKIAPQLEALWQAWKDTGLLDRISSWNGSFVPRFIRGSKTRLSNHAWGTAFDLNASYNGLNVTPPLVGTAGSVRELVPLAAKHGFYWGGWYRRRKDGMHFEAVKIVKV